MLRNAAPCPENRKLLPCFASRRLISPNNCHLLPLSPKYAQFDAL
jgi:hypothetical protein